MTPVSELDLAPERPGRRYQLKNGENLYDVALKFKCDPAALMSHNEITDYKTVLPGDWLYLPTPEAKPRLDIEYRILEAPRAMHVAHIGGTTKFSFGGVKTWADIKMCHKHYTEQHNVDIYAIAKVPVEDTVAAYYMDKHDLGNYEATGRPAYTRGFNWQHLAEGHVTVEKPVTKVQQIVADAMAEDDRPALPEKHELPTKPVEEPVVTPEPEEVHVAPLEQQLDDYKQSFKYLNIEESPERFRLLEAMDIRDMDGISPPIHRKADSPVLVSGWFVHNGTPYYRVATRHWYGIPTQAAYSIEDEPFNGFSASLPERIAMGGTLSREERRMVLFAKTAAKYNRIKTVSALLRRKK